MGVIRRRLFAALFLALVGTTSLEAQFDSGLPIGTKLPAVTINDLDGKPFDLTTVLGKTAVMFEFWATWCPVCKSLEPQLHKVKAKFADRVTIIGVNIAVNESKERVRRYLTVHKPPFTTLYDDKGVTARSWEVPTTGFIMIVDAAGVVRYTGSGTDQDLVAALVQVLGK